MSPAKRHLTVDDVRDTLGRDVMKLPWIEPRSSGENGYVESLNGKLLDELPAREVFDTLLEGKALIERWRKNYNTLRPHGSPGY